MNAILKIDKSLKIPVYQQIVNSVVSRIEDGSLSLGSQLPSINQMAGDYNLARETVVKAFKILQEQGTISPVQGKGYFVSSLQFNVSNRIFLFFDTFSAYKEVIYHALKDRFGADAFIDIYFHHFNFKVFEKTIRESNGNYQSYVIIPIENNKMDEVLDLIPSEKLFLLDIQPQTTKISYSGVFQNFEVDIFQSLTSVVDHCRKYSKLILVFRNQITDPPVGIVTGFQKFCWENKINSQIIRSSILNKKPKRGEAYIVIDDEDLVYLVDQARASNLLLGTDLGLLSYNETPLKKIACNGISVISTDFAGLGNQIAEMVINKQKAIKYNTFRFIDRSSF